MIKTFMPAMLLGCLFGVFMVACSPSVSNGKKPSTEGRLKPCPGSPNCVSSRIAHGSQSIAPIQYQVSHQEAYQALTDILTSNRRARITVQQPGYIHAEFSSRLFGFVDDVEFLFLSDQPLIHVRSASRSGYWDFGANRKRIERIRRQLDDAMQ